MIKMIQSFQTILYEIILGCQQSSCVFFNPLKYSQNSQKLPYLGYIYRKHEYLANNNKTTSKEASSELELEITRRELRVLLIHKFRLGLHSNRSSKQSMQHDEQRCTLHLYSATMARSI